MYPGTKAVKVTAKASLKGKYFSAVSACLIAVFSVFILMLSATLLSKTGLEFLPDALEIFGAFFLIFPLFLGILRYLWRILFSADDSVVSCFYYFSNGKLYKKAVKFAFLYLLRLAFYLLLLMLPAITVDIISNESIIDFFNLILPLWAENLQNLRVILYVLAVIALPFVTLKYYMAPVLFIADENIDPSEAIHMSKTVSAKSRADFIVLCLSFFGWFVLSLAVFTLPFVLPYFLTSYEVHVRFVIAQYNKRIKSQNESFGGFPGFML